MTLNDIYAARTRISDIIRPTPLMSHPLLSGRDRARPSREARESQSDERLQGARRLEPGSVADGRRARARHRHGQHRKSRPVDRALPRNWKASVAPSLCPTATTPTRMRRCGHLARRSPKADAISTRPENAASRQRPPTGARYVHSANEPLLIAGVGTYALEIFEALPDVDTILVPLGGGSGACGNCLVAHRASAPKRE